MANWKRGLGQGLQLLGRGMLADAFDAKKAERETELALSRARAVAVIQEEFDIKSDARKAARDDMVYGRARADQKADLENAYARQDKIRSEDRGYKLDDDARDFDQSKQLIGIQGAESRRTAAAGRVDPVAQASAIIKGKIERLTKAGYSEAEAIKIAEGVAPKTSGAKIIYSEDEMGNKTPSYVEGTDSNGNPVALPYGEFEAIRTAASAPERPAPGTQMPASFINPAPREAAPYAPAPQVNGGNIATRLLPQGLLSAARQQTSRQQPSSTSSPYLLPGPYVLP